MIQYSSLGQIRKEREQPCTRRVLITKELSVLSLDFNSVLKFVFGGGREEKKQKHLKELVT